MNRFKKVLLALIASITVLGGAFAFNGCSCLDDSIISIVPQQQKFTVYWKNSDGTVIIETDFNVEKDTAPSYNSPVPQKADDYEFTYQFIGWAAAPNSTTAKQVSELSPIAADTTFYAVFAKTARKYTITWKNGTGELEVDPNVAAFAFPSYDSAEPTRAPTAQYEYTFAGWSTDPDALTGVSEASLPQVTADATYYAIFTQSVRKYNVRFFFGTNPAPLQTSEVEYGAYPEYFGEDITKDDDAEFTYQFAGWVTSENANIIHPSDKLPKVTGDLDLYVEFNPISLDKATVIWWSHDGLERLRIDYEDALDSAFAYAGTEPERTMTAQYSYTFAGWQSTMAAGGVVAAMGDMTVDINNIDGGLESLFNVYAIFTRTERSYSVVFKDGDGSDLQNYTRVYGKTVGFDFYGKPAPTKAETVQYTYEFKGWKTSPDATNYYPTGYIFTVTGELTLYPYFEAVTRKYEVQFKDYDGGALSTIQVEYGAVPTYTEPTRTSLGGKTYEFKGWYVQGESEDTATKNLPGITGAVIYRAAYIEREAGNISNVRVEFNTVFNTNADWTVKYDSTTHTAADVAVYKYRVFGTNYSTSVTEKPAVPGKYTVRVELPKNATNEAVWEEVDFYVYKDEEIKAYKYFKTNNFAEAGRIYNASKAETISSSTAQGTNRTVYIEKSGYAAADITDFAGSRYSGRVDRTNEWLLKNGFTDSVGNIIVNAETLGFKVYQLGSTFPFGDFNYFWQSKESVYYIEISAGTYGAIDISDMDSGVKTALKTALRITSGENKLVIAVQKYSVNIGEEFEGSDLRYQAIDADSYRVLGLKSSLASAPVAITVPNEINGKAVTEIADNAFYALYGGGTDGAFTVALEAGTNLVKIGNNAFGSSYLSSITINSAGLKTIGYRAFYNSDITTVTIPNSVEVIGIEAFRLCVNLTSFNIDMEDSKLTTLGNQAFGYTKITTINLPKSLTKAIISFGGAENIINFISMATNIPYVPFENCAQLITISVHANNTVLYREENGIYRKDSNKTLFFVFSGVTSIELDTECKDVMNWVFDFCPKLTHIYISNNPYFTIDRLVSLTEVDPNKVIK